jgi:hypothetical protein
LLCNARQDALRFSGLEVGQGFELWVADHLIRITVVRAADDLDLGAAGGSDHAEVGARPRQVDGAGDQCLDDQIRRHVGRLDVEIFFGEEAFFLGGDIVNIERRRIGRADRNLVGGRNRASPKHYGREQECETSDSFHGNNSG